MALKENQRSRAIFGDLPAQLRADRAAGARDDDPFSF